MFYLKITEWAGFMTTVLPLIHIYLYLMIGFIFDMCFRGKPVNMENLMNPTGKDFEPEESAVLALIKERSK